MREKRLSWEEVRHRFPDQWVVIEALRTHSKENKRIVDALSVINHFDDSEMALREYLKLHREDRQKELYVVHTDRQNLDITERKWLGIRPA